MVVGEPLQIPDVLLSVILEYEGALIRSWKMDYIQSVYVEAFKRYFGHYITFKRIFRNNSYLGLYCHFAKWMHNDNIWIRKRPSTMHMKPWVLAFPNQCNNLERKAIISANYHCNVVKLMKDHQRALRVIWVEKGP